MNLEKKYRYSCNLHIGVLYPVRDADSEEEFIEELINEYNGQCEGLLDIRRSDISKIQIEEENEDEDEEDEDDDEA